MEVKIAEIGTKLEKDEEKINSHIEDFRMFQKEVREHLKKIDAENIALHKLAVSIEQLANNLTLANEKIDDLAKKQEEIGIKITNIEQAPAKKALKFSEGIKEKIFLGIIISIVSFLLGSIFPFSITI